MQFGSMFHARPIAAAYELLTSQDVWRRHIAALLGTISPPDDHEMQVLDLGCGPGESSFVVASLLGSKASVTGIDLAPAMVQRAQNRLQRHHRDLHNVRFETGDGADLRFADASFDLALGHSFLYLVPDRIGVLREAKRVLRPGGHLLLMEPHRHGSLLRAARLGARHLASSLRRPLTTYRFVASMLLWRVVSGRAGRLGRDELAALLTRAGFRDVTIEPAFGGLGLHARASRPRA